MPKEAEFLHRSDMCGSVALWSKEDNPWFEGFGWQFLRTKCSGLEIGHQ